LLRRIECEGAPRDLGLAQGRACRDAVRDHVARAGAPLRRRPYPVLTPWSSGSQLGVGAGREIIRHYPHLAERMAGLALGSDVPLESLVSSLLTVSPPSTSASLHAPAVALADEASGAAMTFAARTFAPSPVPSARPVLRRSRPEVGFASVELTLPWLASAIAGVNSEGVAVLLARSDVGGERGAPPGLLVQECLQRFGSLDGCLDWCMKRSAAGNALLFIAHESEGAAAVEFTLDEAGGESRRVIRPSDGLLIEGMSSAAELALRKQRQPLADSAGSSVDESVVGAEGSLDWLALADESCRGDVPRSLAVRLEPASRQLIVQPVDAAQSERRTELVAT